MSADISVISVISSSVVAIAVVVVTQIMNSSQDSRKWARERRAAISDRIVKATGELLAALAVLRSGEITDTYTKSPPTIYTQLLAKYYAWENEIWLYCNSFIQADLRNLRNKLENSRFPNLLSDGPALANAILDITHKIEL